MIRKNRSETKLEIERKFLVKKIPEEIKSCPGEKILQGYITIDQEETEIRLRKREDACSLTIKSGRGLERRETEIVLTSGQFDKLWPLTEDNRIDKVRYEIKTGGVVVELDIYGGPLTDLKTAEVEFSSKKESETFTPLSWFGKEVTEDERYKNRNLVELGLPEEKGA